MWRRIRRLRPRGPLLACPVRFQANHLKNFFPSDWHVEHPIVYVKGDLQKDAGRVPGGTACCCSESIACDLGNLNQTVGFVMDCMIIGR